MAPDTTAEKTGPFLSVIALGFGFLLGAPLNVLVSETAGQNKGTALGTLSLVRPTPAMTLAVTNSHLSVTHNGNRLKPANAMAPDTTTAGQNKGTALGTLSLVRQVGLTLAPALYAGFITAEPRAEIRNRPPQ
jgi:hypothetical protein